MSVNREIFGIKIDSLTKEEVLNSFNKALKNDKKCIVATVNPEILLKILTDSNYAEAIRVADIITPDGIGILWAINFNNEKIKYNNYISYLFKGIWLLIKVLFDKKYLYKYIPERVTGTELLNDVLFDSSDYKKKVFLLGAIEKVNKKLVEMVNRDGKLVHAEGYSGNPSAKMERKIVNKINKSGSNMLFVAFGAPKQEKWLYRNINLMSSVKVAMGVGGAFDFLSGYTKRAPIFIQKMGLEWLWRVVLEPKRLVRIINATVVFPLKVINRKYNSEKK